MFQLQIHWSNVFSIHNPHYRCRTDTLCVFEKRPLNYIQFALRATSTALKSAYTYTNVVQNETKTVVVLHFTVQPEYKETKPQLFEIYATVHPRVNQRIPHKTLPPPQLLSSLCVHNESILGHFVWGAFDFRLLIDLTLDYWVAFDFRMPPNQSAR